MEATWMSIGRWMDKKVWYTYTMEYYSAIKNAFESILIRWMNLEPVIQSEISQKEKHQYSILTHYMEFRKMVTMTLYVRQQKRHRLLDYVGENEGGMIWENSIETCILLYVKQIASPGSMHETGCLGLCTGMVLRDGIGREEGWGFRMGDICTPMADSCQYIAKPLQYCKVVSLQLK